MRGLGKVLFLLLGITASAGCARGAFHPTTTMALSPRPVGCYLDIILDGGPPFPYVVIGRVTTDASSEWWMGESNDIALQRMQEAACRAGAHGLLHVNSQSQKAARKHDSRSTTGSAVAFVYVDPSGRPLPLPRGTHVVIHPGANAAPAAPPPAPAPSASPAIAAPGAMSAAPAPGQ